MKSLVPTCEKLFMRWKRSEYPHLHKITFFLREADRTYKLLDSWTAAVGSRHSMRSVWA